MANARFTWVSEATEVAPGFHVIALNGSWGTDLPLVELSLVIDTPEGIVVVAGCSHPTIEKIIATAADAVAKPIHLVIGGTHLIPAPEAEIRRIATALRDTWEVKWIAPAHCTGERAFEILQEAFGARYIYAGLGTTVGLGINPLSRRGDSDASHFFDAEDAQTYRLLKEEMPGLFTVAE